MDCLTVKYKTKKKTNPWKIHVLTLLNRSKATVKFIFKYVLYITKYNIAKTKLAVLPTMALFSSAEFFLGYTMECGQ